MSTTLQNDVAVRYYETTAARSHVRSVEHYRRSAAGLLRWLRPWLPADRNARCLDLACGCGEFLFALEQGGFKRTAGVDLCPEEIEEARRFVRGDLAVGNVLESLRRAPDSSFDFITALNVFEHLSKDQLASVLREARRVLASGGTLVAMVPNAISPLGTLTRHWDITHEWAFVPNNFRQLGALTGYSPRVDVLECGPRPHGLFSAVRWALWQAVRLAIAFRFLVEVADAKGGVYTMDMLVRLHAGSE